MRLRPEELTAILHSPYPVAGFKGEGGGRERGNGKEGEEKGKGGEGQGGTGRGGEVAHLEQDCRFAKAGPVSLDVLPTSIAYCPYCMRCECSLIEFD